MKPRTGPNDVKVRLTEKFWRRFGAPINEKSAQLVVFTTRYADFGGERGIRTPGASQHGGFQDRCNRPLYHLSFVRDKLRVSKRVQRYGFIFNLARFLPFFFKKMRFILSFSSKKAKSACFLGAKQRKRNKKELFIW